MPSSAVDVTDRHEADEFRAVVMDNMAEGLYALDVTGSLTYMNQAAARMLGWDENDLRGTKVHNVVHYQRADGAPLPEHACDLLDVRERGRTIRNADDAFTRRDGTIMRVAYSAAPLRTGTTITGIVVVFRDITDELRADSLGRAYSLMSQTMHASVNASDSTILFDDLCRIAVESGDYLGAWVGVPADAGAVRVAASHGDLIDGDLVAPMTMDAGRREGQGPSGTALREGRAVYVDDAMEDESTLPWWGWARTHGVRAWFAIPLLCGDVVVAVLNLHAATTDVVGTQARLMLEAVAAHVSVALTALDAAERLAEVSAHRSELLTRLVRAREDERAQIAGNIHDDSVQVLAAVDLRMTLLQRKLRSAAPDLSDDVDELRTTLHAATQRLRHLLFELETVDAYETLADAVRRAARYLFADSGVAFTIDDDGVGDVPEIQRGQSIRIVKEALINVRDHAAASTVTVRLRRAGSGLEVSVLDDGVGVEEGATSSPPGHRGLSTMRDRAEMAGGRWHIERRETGGTAVRFWLPDTGATQIAS